MMLSFVVPAHNEEAEIGRTLRALTASAASLKAPYEVLVVDDASTDRTAALARSFKATVVPVDLRNISAVRNAGARAARGDALVFVDADTVVPPGALSAAAEALRRGAVGGGARVRFEEGVPLWARAAAFSITWPMARLRWAAGCFLFARREAFRAVGGFDERYLAGEEILLSRALKGKGRFVIVPEAVVTSGRKVRLFPARQLLGQLFRVAFSGGRALRRREDLDMWYDGRRERGEPAAEGKPR